MAERVIVVCDVCGKAPAQTVAITASGKSYRKDLCAEHLSDLLKGARTPKRGRPARPPAATTTAASAKRASAAPAASSGAKRERKKITDPVLLEKRRAALAKARQARADKRAAAKGTA